MKNTISIVGFSAVGALIGANVLYAALSGNMWPTVSSGSVLSSENWNALVANVQELDTRSYNTDSRAGEVITVWGRWSAPNGTTLLMSGWGFWPYYVHTGAEPFCMKENDPGGTAAGTNYGDLLYPLWTGDAARMPPGITAARHIRCSQVFVPSTTFQLMGTQSCPAGWSSIYVGYSMGWYQGHTGRITKSLCMDATNFDATRSWSWTSGGSFVAGSFLWATSDATNYPADRWVKCAICKKN